MHGGQLMRRGRAFALLAVAAWGCSNGPDPGTSVATTGALAQGLAQAYCDWQARCCAPAEISLLEGSGAGAGNGDADGGATASCLGRAGLATAQQLAPMTVAVNQGLVTINSTAASACVDAYRNRPCNRPPIEAREAVRTVIVPAQPEVDEVVAACPGLFVGAVSPGGRCDMTAECLPGSRCLKQGAAPDAGGTIAGSATLGVCFPLQQPGASCLTSDDCDASANLYCRLTDFVCASPAGFGEPCLLNNFQLPVIACDATAHLFCAPGTSTCAPLPVSGEPCLTTSAASVPACDPDPTLNLTCVAGICKPPGAAGDACGASGLPACSLDLGCTGADARGIGTCTAPPVPGAACGVDGSCASPAVCGDDGVCATPGAAPVGAQCPSGVGDCLSRSCLANFIGPTCAAPTRWGVRCAGNGATAAAFLESDGPAP